MTIAGYELLAKLASGGMAEIWVAQRKQGYGSLPDSVCVVKKLLPQHEGKDDFIQMFLDEGRIGKRMAHPNIARVFDVGSSSGTHYLAMEYLHGEDFRTVLRTLRAKKRLPPLGLALRVAIDIGRALDHAHEMTREDGTPLGLVHRDVSPHNVFVTFDGAVKLVDFGIAKTKDRDWETKHGTLKGKVPYMAPEQIRARALDRRTDVYALGVVLYESVVGKRPYVLTAPGEFATMMAIARGDIAPPSTINPQISRALEAIIMRALSHNPKDRYATARELADALETFAKRESIDTSSQALSAFIRELFGGRVDRWRAALETNLAAHVVEVENERERQRQASQEEDNAETELYVPVSTGTELAPAVKTQAMPEPPTSTPMIANISHAVASVTELLGVTIVSLHGRLDEQFAGAKLASSLRGPVLFDLKGVERVTSFGVREWIEMVRALDGQNVEAWISRCPEPVVTQMTLVPSFLGSLKLASFDAPFLCDDCGMSFVRSIDCEGDGDLILGTRAAIATCTQCGGQARLDDEPNSFAFARSFAGASIPFNVRTLMTTLDDRDRAAGDVVTKLVTDDETRIYVRREVDESFRWSRVLDGIEGRLVIDFRSVTRLAKASAEGFARALRALGREISACEVVEAPVAIALALAPTTRGKRYHLDSVVFEGRCPACSATRSGSVATTELEAAAQEGRAPFIPCRRCNGPLEASEIDEVLTKLRAKPASFLPESDPKLEVSTVRPIEQVGAPSSPQPASSGELHRSFTTTSSSSFALPSSAAPRRRAAVVVGIGATLIVTFVIIVAAIVRSRPTVNEVVTTTSASPPTSSSAAEDPDEVSGTIGAVTKDGEGLSVTVRSRGATEDQAIRAARQRAIVLLLDQIAEELPPTIRAATHELPKCEDFALVEERFERQIGSRASPERVQFKAHRDGGEVVLTSRYRLSTSSLATAIDFYKTTKSLLGVTVAQPLPSHGESPVVVLATGQPKLHPGAELVSVDGRRRPTLASISAATSHAVFVDHGATVEVATSTKR